MKVWNRWIRTLLEAKLRAPSDHAMRRGVAPRTRARFVDTGLDVMLEGKQRTAGNLGCIAGVQVST